MGFVRALSELVFHLEPVPYGESLNFTGIWDPLYMMDLSMAVDLSLERAIGVPFRAQ